MKQYCRYCIYLCVNNAPYCDAKKEFRSVKSCKRPNKCKDFILCKSEPEYQDAFGETNGYKPRAKHTRVNHTGEIDCQQMSFFEQGVTECTKVL